MGLRGYIKSLRQYRHWHRLVGTSLAIFFVISALTGILLALKKDIDVLQPPSQKGQSKELADWLPVQLIAERATLALQEARPELSSHAIDRLDFRPSKGMVKVLFEKGYWEVQVDGSSGEVLSIARRHSDWIEALHDGSIVSDTFKLISMHAIGLGLLVLVGSGLWLWYGPRLIRKIKKRRT